MRRKPNLLAPVIAVLLILAASACSRQSGGDLVDDQFPEAQAEIRKVVESIVEDAEAANIDGLKAAHLVSDKFTKFGPRSFDRQDVVSANTSESAFFGSISDYQQEVRGLKIDVFGDVGIATYYPHVSFAQDGEEKTGSGRQTLVFLRTADGWKIVHEHGTPRQ